MKNKKKLKKLKFKTIEEDENIVRNFVILVLIITLLIVVLYLVTNKVTHKKDEKEPKVKTEINYNKVLVGMILNRPYKEYYVLVFNSEDKDALKYNALMNKYINKKLLKLFYCDLYDNKKYYNVGNDNKSNPLVRTESEFDFGEITLLKIKDKKIVQYVENYEKIKNILQ